MDELRRMLTNKQEAKKMFESFFGDAKEVSLGHPFKESEVGENTMIKKKDILNPSPSLYIIIIKTLKGYREAGYDHSLARWNFLLMLKAIMMKSISDIKYSDWLGKYPIIQILEDERC